MVCFAMAKSSLKHPLAVLRDRCKINQTELAKFAKCSLATIQSIETLRMPLSEELAYEIAAVFGVDPVWLVRGDPTVPPTDPQGHAYHSANFRDAKNYKKIARDPMMILGGKVDAEIEVKKLVPRLLKIFAAASAMNRIKLAQFRLEKALQRMEQDFECGKAKGKLKS